MKKENWKEEYPLNTLSEESKKEFIDFIKQKQIQAVEELYKRVEKIDFSGGGSGRRIKVQLLGNLRDDITKLKQ